MALKKYALIMAALASISTPVVAHASEGTCAQLFESNESPLADMWNDLAQRDNTAQAKAEKIEARRAEQKRQAALAADLQLIEDLKSVRSHEDWKALPDTHKYRVLARYGNMPLLEVYKADGSGIRPYWSFVPASALKSRDSKVLAYQMLKFMIENADLKTNNGERVSDLKISYDIFVDKNGAILGGNIKLEVTLNDIEGVERDVAIGTFDHQGRALKFDARFRYDH